MLKYSLVYFDDQPQNIECYQTLLRDRFDVIGCVESPKYMEVLSTSKPHAFLIDLHMPVLDGMGLYQKIVASPLYNGCPIFFISGDQTDESRLLSIQHGAIDYLSRQVPEEELIVRMTSKIRLYLQGTSILELGNLKLDTVSYQTFIDGKPVELTLVETRLLCILMRSPTEPVKKKEVLEKVWDNTTKSGKIYTHLSNLGVKLWDWDYEIRVRGEFISVVSAQ